MLLARSARLARPARSRRSPCARRRGSGPAASRAATPAPAAATAPRPATRPAAATAGRARSTRVSTSVAASAPAVVGALHRQPRLGQRPAHDRQQVDRPRRRAGRRAGRGRPAPAPAAPACARRRPGSRRRAVRTAAAQWSGRARACRCEAPSRPSRTALCHPSCSCAQYRFRSWPATFSQDSAGTPAAARSRRCRSACARARWTSSSASSRWSATGSALRRAIAERPRRLDDLLRPAGHRQDHAGADRRPHDAARTSRSCRRCRSGSPTYAG